MNTQIQKQSTFGLAVTGCLLGLGILIGTLWPSSPDFTKFTEGTERKEAFIDYLAPLIMAANTQILEERETALELRTRSDDLGFLERYNLRKLGESYELEEFDSQKTQHWNELLERINAIPPSLAIAQAANESAWGTSRFAREGNNYFGQWCFEPGCGLVPKSRATGKTHEVARFSATAESVKAYMDNLNRNSAYRSLRSLRAQQSERSGPVSGTALADGLLRYSERGQEYVLDIKEMIQNNQLEQYDRPDG
jgi:Bax protein